MLGNLSQILSMVGGVWLARVELQTAHHGDDIILVEHDIEQRCFVEEEQRAEDVVDVVEAVRVLEILADVEELEQLGDVVLSLHCQREVLAVHRGRDRRRDQVEDFVQFGELARRELDSDGALVQSVGHVPVFLLCYCMLGQCEHMCVHLYTQPMHRLLHSFHNQL